MDADKMTPEELRELARQKEEAEETKVYKEGFLKHDLYRLDCDREWTYILPAELRDNFWLLSPEQHKAALEDFKNSFEKVLKKGARFVAFKNDDGQTYSWFDDEGYGVEEMDDTWAKQYLTNIKDVT